MKKYLLGIALMLVVAFPLYAASPDPITRLIALLTNGFSQQTKLLTTIAQNTAPTPIRVGGGGVLLTRHFLNSNSATTSTTHVALATATSTFAYTAGSADHIDINMEVTSSTTVPVIVWFNEFSNDCAGGNFVNCSWHGEDGNTIDSTTGVTHGASVVKHYWTPAATTSIGEIFRKNVAINPSASKFIRMNFRTIGAAADWWIEAVTRERNL